MILRRILAPVAALSLTVSATYASTNPEGHPVTDKCPTCSAPDGTGTGHSSSHSSSFEWTINVGLARYPKPASYTGIGTPAYERNGNLPTFKELVGRYFPGGPLQQSQVPLRI